MKELTIHNLQKLPFNVEEAINQLRVNLSFCGDQIKVIMVTSSLPDEGKSFVTIHLWKMLAELGSRVLLIDCDLRKSELRSRYGIGSKEKITGIAHYLAGKVELDDAIYATNIHNGFFCPLSSTVINPTLLLENDRLTTMLEQCAAAFDYVLIDTPPLEIVVDALHIAPHADGTVMVVRSGHTSRKAVINTVNQLKRTGTPILGLVLNRVDADQHGRYYYKRYYHNKVYGKEYAYKNK